MDRSTSPRRRHLYLAAVWMLCAVWASAAAWLSTTAHAAGATPAHFTTPESAVNALVDAARHDRPRRLLEILGDEGRQLVYSGDRVEDARGRARFVAAFDQANRIEKSGDDGAMLIIGEKAWPFPIPLVRRHGAWRFDTAAGAHEVLDRRIGRNELSAMQVCRAFVDAQREYAMLDRNNDGLREYAQRFMSTPGTRDGLYWPAAVGEPDSPMGPLIATARAEGYPAEKPMGSPRVPYHGYYYRILTSQGAHATDGARDYFVGGRMASGFALVAFPARYGDSGIMTFIVNQDGIVYQKNLGPQTASEAQAMRAFDPGPGWVAVPSEPPR